MHKNWIFCPLPPIFLRTSLNHAHQKPLKTSEQSIYYTAQQSKLNFVHFEPFQAIPQNVKHLSTNRTY